MEKQSITNTSSSSWVRGSCIGRGSFGSVNTAVNKTNGEVFAVKSVDLVTCLQTQSESLENEIIILGSLKPHPNIVRFLGEGFSKEGTSSFRNLHLEYLPEGDVANYHAAGGIAESLLRRYTTCLVSALRHVHWQGYVHCDVKARNILVSRSSVIKLADFGSAIRFGNSTTATEEITPRGSPLWMAPEVIRREYQGPESDVWSLGCTIVEILTGKPAWAELGITDSLSRIGYSDELPSFPTMLSENGQDFLDKCLKRDPKQRWSCDQLLHHPFLSDQGHHDSWSITEPSPRCVLDWVNSGFEVEDEEETRKPELETRIRKLATTGGAVWESDGWFEVRCHSSGGEGTIIEYPESIRVESEFDIFSDISDDVADDMAMTDVWTSPYRSPGNQGSAAAMLDGLVVVLCSLIKIVIYYASEIIVTIYGCCMYQCGNNKKEFICDFFFLIKIHM